MKTAGSHWRNVATLLTWLMCLWLPLVNVQAANPFLPSPKLPSGIKPSLIKTLKPVISRLLVPSCVRPGSTITVYGRNFGTRRGKLVVLGSNVRLSILGWTTTRISARIPATARLAGGSYTTLSLYTDPFVTRRYTRLVTASQRLRVCSTATSTTTKPVIKPGIPTRPVIKPGIFTRPGTKPNIPVPKPTIPGVPTRPKPPVIGAPPRPKPPVLGAPPRPRPPFPKPPTGPFVPKPTPPKSGTGSGAGDSSTSDSATSDSDSSTPDDSGGDDDFGDDEGDSDDGSERQRPDSSGSLTDTELPSAPSGNDEGDDGTPKPPRNAEAGELLVISRNMAAARQLGDELTGEGYGIKRRRRLGGLNLVVTVFRPPEGTGLQESLTDLRKRFPKLWMSYNHRWLPQPVQQPSGTGKPGCAAGLRIGVIGGRLDGVSGVNYHSLLPIGVATAGDDTTRRLVRGLTRRLPGVRIDLAVILRSGQGATAESVLRALDWLGNRKVRHIWLPMRGPRNLAIEAAIVRLRSRGITIHRDGTIPASLKTRCPASS